MGSLESERFVVDVAASNLDK
uniref:Probable cinnamyl alcohol dehydrogenase 1 (Fragments) n=1 Tax=Pseudotsuga menziesii TaxID=3357 RepID=CADH1_PSEMZ|nr:RecName: Full=Probable cinnamyl alcohol dehydrogenase 1; Short=CAD 1 [Pseudotsuga menziesii]